MDRDEGEEGVESFRFVGISMRAVDALRGRLRDIGVRETVAN